MFRSTALSHLNTTRRATIVVTGLTTVAAAIAEVAGAGAVARFVLSGIALAAAAAMVGQAIEDVGEHWGPGATSLLQSTLGNLPELFVGLFALSNGLVVLVRAALVGSVLGNTLLVLGLAFLAGGAKHGVQRFDPQEPRLDASLLLVVVAALLVPTLANQLGTPAASHTGTLSNVCSVILLIVYAASVPYSIWVTSSGARRDQTPTAARVRDSETAPLSLSIGLLVVATAIAALASHWFVTPLQSATTSLGISEMFTGLVVVAIASNAVEHVVGIRFALRSKPEYAISSTLNSALQVALLLTPVLVLVSGAVGPTKLTLVFPPLLVAALAVSAVVVIAVVYDGEYTWLEGLALIGLYCIIAAGFWWG